MAAAAAFATAEGAEPFAHVSGDELTPGAGGRSAGRKRRFRRRDDPNSAGPARGRGVKDFGKFMLPSTVLIRLIALDVSTAFRIYDVVVCTYIFDWGGGGQP